MKLSRSVMLQSHGTTYRPDSFVWMLRYCANLKAIRYEPTSLNRIVADKSHRVIVALHNVGNTVLKFRLNLFQTATSANQLDFCLVS